MKAKSGHRIIKDENKDDSLLCRKEFIELFFRLAVIEYPPDPQTGAMKPSFTQFLEVNIYHNIPRDLVTFRKQEVWTREVNDLLRVNES